MNRVLLFLLISAITSAAQPKALFYMTTNPTSVKSFADHADKIDILVPAWYGVDGNGLMWGAPNPFVLQTAAQHHVPVMPIVATTVQADLHKLFTTPAARQAFIDSVLSECKKNGYTGFQIDFENVKWTDRDLLPPSSPKLPPRSTRRNCNSPSPPCPTLPELPEKAASRTGSMPTGAALTI